MWSPRPGPKPTLTVIVQEGKGRNRDAPREEALDWDPQGPAKALDADVDHSPAGWGGMDGRLSTGAGAGLASGVPFPIRVVGRAGR
jgi:hypothetical protein